MGIRYQKKTPCMKRFAAEHGSEFSPIDIQDMLDEYAPREGGWPYGTCFFTYEKLTGKQDWNWGLDRRMEKAARAYYADKKAEPEQMEMDLTQEPVQVQPEVETPTVMEAAIREAGIASDMFRSAPVAVVGEAPSIIAYGDTNLRGEEISLTQVHDAVMNLPKGAVLTNINLTYKIER